MYVNYEKKILGVVVWNWWSRNHAKVDCVGTQCCAVEIRSAHISLSEHQGLVNWWSRNHAEVDCVGTQCCAVEIRSAHISLSEHQGFVKLPWAVVNKYFTETQLP